MLKRPAPNEPVRVGICLYPGVWESSASLARDLLHIADVITRARSAGAGIETQYLSHQGGTHLTASGTSVSPVSPWEHTEVDLIVLPSLAIPYLDRSSQPPELAGWIAQQHQRGCLVLAITTGSWVLAATGLLDGRSATTHWASLKHCRRQHPAINWTSEQRVAVGGRVVTARDVSAAAAALCHLIGRLVGVPIAERTYEYSLIHTPGSDVLPLLHTLSLRDHHDTQILRVQDWLEAHCDEARSAVALAEMVHLSPRSLRRRFHSATGQTLSSYRIDVRLARARALLLSTTEPVSQIAYRIGYENASTFIALFKKRHGLTPSAYRRASASIPT